MTWKTKLLLGILTAVAMFVLSFLVQPEECCATHRLPISDDRWSVGNFCAFICKVEVAAVRAAIFLASGGVGAVNVLKTFVLSGGVGESRRADTVIPRFLLTATLCSD